MYNGVNPGKVTPNLCNLCLIVTHKDYICKQKTFFQMSETRSGEMISAQIEKIGTIDNLNNADFTLNDGRLFNIKNDGVAPVKLQIQLGGMDAGEWIETTFEIGWNPEIVKAVKQTSLSGINLKWGY